MKKGGELMSVDREVRHNLELTYARLAGEPPEQAFWSLYSAGKGGGTATIRALDRFLSMMNERGDHGIIQLASLTSGTQRSMGRKTG